MKVVYDVDVYKRQDDGVTYKHITSKSGYASPKTAKVGARTIVHKLSAKRGVYCYGLVWSRWGGNNYEGLSFLQLYKVTITKRHVKDDFNYVNFLKRSTTNWQIIWGLRDGRYEGETGFGEHKAVITALEEAQSL